MPASRRALYLAPLLVACAGCMVGPTYRAAPANVPNRFGELGRLDGSLSASTAAALPSGAPVDPEQLRQWWTVFHDPMLDSLIARALQNNWDLQIAISRVREARAERAIAAGGLWPEIDATTGYNRGYGSKNVQLPLSALGAGSAAPAASPAASANAGPGIAKSARAEEAGGGAAPSGPSASAPPGGPSSPFGEGGLPGVTTNLYQLGFDAVWEIDVFGGTRRTIQAADAQAAAAEEGERGVRVTLLAEVARSYLQLRADQAREAIARRNLAAERLTWKIAADKFKAGLGDELPVDQEAAQYRLTEATLAPLQAAERAGQHAVAFLLGEVPTALASELSPLQALPALPPDLPIGVPSELLRRRPDVRQAERNLAAATAEVGVATAQLFPQFSLTGSLGLDSSELHQLPEWGSHYYSIAPGIRWPILDWAQLRAAIRVEDERQTQAALAYQTAVAQALKDVEDGLVRYSSDRGRHAALIQAVAAARRAHRVAEQIHQQGLTDLLATLTAEQTELQAEDALAQSDASLRIDLVGLYKALGGGWSPD